MPIRIYIGGASCPACGGTLTFSGHTEIEIYNARCPSCGKKLHVIMHPDGRREIREKTIN